MVQGTWADHPPASHALSCWTAVYTGVHSAGDVVIGVTGVVIGRATTRLAVRITRPS